MIRHTISPRPAIRVDWPFFKMKIGDFIEFKGKDAKHMRSRAMAASNHYKKTRGFQFKSQKIHNGQYIVWRHA